ncbi:hypothetical protein L4D08_22140 [Photobacterium chitinilyticum]|uniref:hypothetical protein n=1 Tax=Photobacterium chitinilyticum TaxID=2485123 RepID=UPI003D145CD0
MSNQHEKILAAQQFQTDRTSDAIAKLEKEMVSVARVEQDNADLLDELEAFIGEVDALEKVTEFELSEFELSNTKAMSDAASVIELEVPVFHNWEQFERETDAYLARHHLSFDVNRFERYFPSSHLDSCHSRVEQLCREFDEKTRCDKWDYSIAACSGVVGGIIDSLFVDIPGEGSLTKAADKGVDGLVQQFARMNGWNGPRGDSDPKVSAIRFLEKKFEVKYDHRTIADFELGCAPKGITPTNHHLLSLPHSPDLIGLVFSIINQFTNTASFIGTDGKLITINANHELQGSDLVSKIFAGFINWLGHVLSDMAGANGSKGRGTGVPIPFYSILLKGNIGEIGAERRTLAECATKLFEQGYDFRHGLAMAVPVMVTELLCRMGYCLKQRYVNERPWIECIPVGKDLVLQKMLLASHGTLCLIDLGDAAVRSGGFNPTTLLRMNIVAWARFGQMGISQLINVMRQRRLDLQHEFIIDSLNNELRNIDPIDYNILIDEHGCIA